MDGKGVRKIGHQFQKVDALLEAIFMPWLILTTFFRETLLHQVHLHFCVCCTVKEKIFGHSFIIQYWPTVDVNDPQY